MLGSNDGIFRVPVAGPERGHFAVQNPGENGTFAEPESTWPHSDDFPRPSVCVVYRRA